MSIVYSVGEEDKRMMEPHVGVVHGDARRAKGAPAIERAVLGSEPPRGVVAEWTGADDTDPHEPPAAPNQLTVHTAERDAPGTGGPTRWGWRSSAAESPVRRIDVHAYPIDDEALVYDPQTQSLYQLNETAFAIWRRCDGRTLREIASALAGTYDVDPQAALDHVSEVVQVLAIGGLFAQEATDAGSG